MTSLTAVPLQSPSNAPINQTRRPVSWRPPRGGRRGLLSPRQVLTVLYGVKGSDVGDHRSQEVHTKTLGGCCHLVRGGPSFNPGIHGGGRSLPDYHHQVTGCSRKGRCLQDDIKQNTQSTRIWTWSSSSSTAGLHGLTSPTTPSSRLSTVFYLLGREEMKAWITAVRAKEERWM